MSLAIDLDIATPRWSMPLLEPRMYKGAKGGRASGKSHFFAESVVEACVTNPDCSVVCIREIQKSLKYSAKRLIEGKISKLGVSHLFKITNTEISRVDGTGVIIFQGMQDHTAESIKSLEGFDIAWCEEAQSLSARSIELLLPTMRKDSSEVWFSWNPDQPDDPVEKLFAEAVNDPDMVVVHVNFTDNPFCPEKSKKDAARSKRVDPDAYAHVWLGGYNTKSDDQVLAGKWSIDEFTVAANDWDGPYYGADWGFSTDPNTLLECYIDSVSNILYITREAYKHGVEIVDTPAFFDQVEGAKNSTVRADNARPEIISHMQKNGYPRVEAVEKWPGSVEDGISTLRGFDKIVIHTGCEKTQEEARLWKYKRDRLTNDVTTKLIDKHNHCWDAVRYALAPLIKSDDLTELLKLAVGAN